MIKFNSLFTINYKLLASISIKHDIYKYFLNCKGYKSRFYKYTYNNNSFYYNEKVNEITNSSGDTLGVPELLNLGFTEEQIKIFN